MARNLLLVITMLTAVGFSSCGSDGKEEQITLDGVWNIYYAERNGKVTKTLEEGIFTFSADTSFTTNIFGDEKLFTFENKGNRLITTSGEPELNFKTASNGVDSLSLTGKIKMFKMEIFLVKDSVR